MFVFPASQNLFNALLTFAGKRNRQRDSWQLQHSCKPSHGSISNQGFCQHKVSGVCQPQTFSPFNIVKETLFIHLTLCENRNCEENGSLAIVTGRHPHVCSVFGSCDRYELDCCTNVLPITAQHWQDIEMQRDSWRPHTYSRTRIPTLCSVLVMYMNWLAA